MEIISSLLFWIPIGLFLVGLLFFVKWDIEKRYLLFLVLAVLFFAALVLNHRHFQSFWLLALRLGGLFLSIAALIFYLSKINKK